MTAPPDAAAVLREMLARRADYLSQGISTYPALLAVERRLCEAAPALLSELDKLREREARLTEALMELENAALAESMKAPQSPDHPWDRGYRAGAAAVWAKIRDARRL